MNLKNDAMRFHTVYDIHALGFLFFILFQGAKIGLVQVIIALHK